MFSIHARSSSVAPRLAANARKSQRSLTPSPPWIWPPMSLSEPGSARSLTCVFVAPGEAPRRGGALGVRLRRAGEGRRGGHPAALRERVRRPHRRRERLAEREAADR